MVEQLTQAEFDWILQQISQREDFLSGREEGLAELFRLCDTNEQRQLVSDLLNRFYIFTHDNYDSTLYKIADYAATLGFKANETLCVAMTKENRSDSSQAIIHDIKVPMELAFGDTVRDINQFNTGQIFDKYTQNGYRHFIVVDEFVGSGDTICERYKDFKKKKMPDATIHFLIMTGTITGLQRVRNEGINIEVFNVINRGISDNYSEPERSTCIQRMLALEQKLAAKINKTKLTDNSLGYKQSEALYYKIHGNIPNNVFPIFWWKQYKSGRKRKTLFIRVQKDY